MRPGFIHCSATCLLFQLFPYFGDFFISIYMHNIPSNGCTVNYLAILLLMSPEGDCSFLLKWTMLCICECLSEWCPQRHWWIDAYFLWMNRSKVARTIQMKYFNWWPWTNHSRFMGASPNSENDTGSNEIQLWKASGNHEVLCKWKELIIQGE